MKRIISMALVVLMTTALFAGCGGSGSGDSATKSDGSAYTSDPVTYTLYLPEHVYQPISTDAMKWDLITEKTGVTLDVDVGVGTEAQTKLTAAAASGKMYDIAFLTHSQIQSLNSSLFMDLTDIMETKTPNYWAIAKDIEGLESIKVDGKYLGFGMTHIDYPDTPVQLAIRYDTLEKHNLSVPKTWDEWFETMKQLKKLYPDSTPFATRSGSYLLEYWTQALGMDYLIHYDDDEDKYVCGVMEEEFRTVLQFMIRCYNEGILDPDFDSSDSTTFEKKVQAGNVFFWMDNGVLADMQTEQLQKSNPSAMINSMPLMTNSFGKKEGLMWTNLTNYASQYCLSATAKYPDRLLEFMNWCYSEEGLLVNTYGKLDETYKLDSDGNPYVPESVWKKYENAAKPSYQWMSDLGLGQLCFAPYYDNFGVVWENYEVDEEDAKYAGIYDKDLEEGNFTAKRDTKPDIGTESISRYDTINTYAKQQVIKFIKGTRSLTEFDSFLSEMKKLGVESLLEECNS